MRGLCFVEYYFCIEYASANFVNCGNPTAPSQTSRNVRRMAPADMTGIAMDGSANPQT